MKPTLGYILLLMKPTLEYILLLMKPTLGYILFLYFQVTISDALPVIFNSNDVNTNSAGEELGATAHIEQLISVRSVREMGYTMEAIIPAYTEAVSHHSKSTLKLHYKTNQYRNDKNGCYENYHWSLSVTAITLLDTK